MGCWLGVQKQEQIPHSISFRAGSSVLISRAAAFLPGSGSSSIYRDSSCSDVNVRVIPMSNAIDESVDIAHEIYNGVFCKVPGRLNGEKQ